MKRFHISKKFLIRVVFLALVISVLVTSGVLAKYLYVIKDETLPVNSKTFYFESNYLTEDNHTYKLNSGTTTIQIELYSFENELRVSEVDCTYTVKVISEDTSFKINDQAYTGEGITLSIAADDIDKTAIVTLDGLKDGNSYKVIVTADGGYQKTLSATFEVAPAQNRCYMSVDNSNDHYVVLTVWTENVTGTAGISFPSGLIPDTSDPILASITNYDGDSFVADTFYDNESFTEAFFSRSYRFFKTEEYQSGTFTVTIDDITAEAATN